MRNILAGTAGVAGLLAVVLAASAGPATAQTVEVFVTDDHPGTYTVSWYTWGGCDPSKPGGGRTIATDGPSGSKSRVVAVPSGTASTASVLDGPQTTGTTAQLSVSTANHCTYNWSATFTSGLGGSKGVSCTIRGANGTARRDGSIDLNTDPNDNGGRTTLDVVTALDGTAGDSCTTVGTIRVDVPRPTSGGKPDQPTSGAILATTFSVTATPVKDSNKECKAVTGESEVDDNDTTSGTAATDDDTVGAQLKVLETPLSDSADRCEYDVVLDLPAGFEARTARSNQAKVTNLRAVVSPSNAADDENGASAALDSTDCGATRYVDPNTGSGSSTDTNNTKAVTVSCHAPVSASVKVSVRDVYILQNVVGDALGGSARYSLSEDKDCGVPADLPQGLKPATAGGIQRTTADTLVELREGFFNISGAVMDPAKPSAPAKRDALNEQADACVVRAAVSDLPLHCSAAAGVITADLVGGVDGQGRAVIRFDITCGQADAGGDMIDGGDMTDGGDDMTDGGQDMVDDGQDMIDAGDLTGGQDMIDAGDLTDGQDVVDGGDMTAAGDVRPPRDMPAG